MLYYIIISTGPRQSFFHTYPTSQQILLCCLHRLNSVVGVIPKRQSFFCYDNGKDRKAHFLMTGLLYGSSMAWEVYIHHIYYMGLCLCHGFRKMLPGQAAKT